jgi:hypothetical protein
MSHPAGGSPGTVPSNSVSPGAAQRASRLPRDLFLTPAASTSLTVSSVSRPTRRTFETAQRVPAGVALGLSRRGNKHAAITRPSISVALFLLATGTALAATQRFTPEPSSTRAIPPPRASATTALALVPGHARGNDATISVVVLRDFLLPSGILFTMHPTEARIRVIATAAAPLKICQLGTTFSTYWKGGCRRLVGRPLALPSSGGAVHVGFRVLPSNGRPTQVTVLRVRWHCVDHSFGLLRGNTVVRSPSPIFDC